ncbi:hypothetical protein ACHWQZ_G015271 [Mnemiopsis leidyi]
MQWFRDVAFRLVVGILNAPSTIANSVLWLIYGPGQNDQPLSDCIQAFDILSDVKPEFAMINQKEYFVNKYIGLKDLSYLDRDDVTLYSVTEQEFIFVRTAPGVDIFDTEEHPFVYNIQHKAAEEMLVATHEAVFQYLRTKPERDGSNIAYLHNPGRCGSTLVANMVAKTGQCEVQSEPTPVLNLSLMMNKKEKPVTRESREYLDLIKSTFLLLCPDVNKKYFIKPWGLETLSLFPLLHQALPGVKEILMCRDLRPTVLSFKKLIPEEWYQSVVPMKVSDLPANYRELWERVKGKEGDADDAFCFLILSEYHAFITETRDRDDIKSYSYESLIAQKELFTRSFLKEIGVGEEHVAAAMSALERDSQANSSTHNKKRTAGVKASVSDQTMEWAVKFAREEFGIELEGEEGRVVNMPHQWNKV